MQSKQRKGSAAPGESNDAPDLLETSKHLSSIDRLLSSALDLMRQTPALDGAAFEQLRQLRVRIRRTLTSVHPTAEEGSLPKVAPELFKNRQDRAEDPMAFTRRVYSKWLGKNICRSDLKRLDVKLYTALYNLDEPREKFEELGLLTKKALNDRLLALAGELKGPSTSLEMLDLSPAERERMRLFNLARRRKQLSSKL